MDAIDNVCNVSPGISNLAEEAPARDGTVYASHTARCLRLLSYRTGCDRSTV